MNKHLTMPVLLVYTQQFDEQLNGGVANSEFAAFSHLFDLIAGIGAVERSTFDGCFFTLYRKRRKVITIDRNGSIA